MDTTRVVYTREWRRKNPESVLRSGQKWNLAHPDQRRALRKSWGARNKDKVKASEKRWRTRHRDQINAKKRLWRAARRRAGRWDSSTERQKHLAWRVANRERYRATGTAWRQRNKFLLACGERARRYGLSVAAFDRFAKRAAGHCECCGRQDMNTRKTALVIDHDHAVAGPESVRGLVCSACNHLLGSGDRRHIERYLRRFGVKTSRALTRRGVGER